MKKLFFAFALMLGIGLTQAHAAEECAAVQAFSKEELLALITILNYNTLNVSSDIELKVETTVPQSLVPGKDRAPKEILTGYHIYLRTKSLGFDGLDKFVSSLRKAEVASVVIFRMECSSFEKKSNVLAVSQ